MAEKLTKQQEQAVYDRGGKLLVSAAAGSGKTKVLVDRLLSYIMDENDPANIDDFLIITYTKAAASELRGKIAAKLTEKIAENPGNKHMQQQMQRLYLTKISTVHSFCSDILREYAYRLDIPADFRVAEENECNQLQLRIIDQLLEDVYGTIGQNSAMDAFLSTQGLGRNDRMIPEILLKTYRSARCHLDPNEWLNMCISDTQADGLCDASQTVWGAYLIRDLKECLAKHITVIEKCCEIATAEGDFEKQISLLNDTLAQLYRLQNFQKWDEIVSFGKVEYGTLTFSKTNKDTVTAARIKAIRNACKSQITKKLEVFADPSEQVLEDISEASLAAKGLVELVREFSCRYDKLKSAKRILDFGDLEHRMLDLLIGKKRTGVTSIAKELGKRYREIMVDEYQDSHGVQDAIFSALTQERNNCFMVGDVKQSIYEFRLADPKIFLNKYEKYCPAEDAVYGQSRKVVLSHNFRSAGQVISAVNDVFCACMSPEVGGLDYGPEEMLREGIPHTKIDEPEIELYGINVVEDTYAEEAAFTAQRIADLLDGSHYIREKDGLRTVKPEDIVILLRSPGSVGGEFRYALEQKGIRCSTGGTMDILQTEEVENLISLLQIINNPLQDIPLVAVLCSRVFGFTADELSKIRSRGRKGSFYKTLLKDDSEKTKNFLKTLECMRIQSRMCSPAELIEYIFAVTRMDSIYAAMPDGDSRLNNLHLFCQSTVNFSVNSGKDLGAFLDFIELLKEKGLAVSGEQNSDGCVTIMSIHKSKGLEFPVVLLCGLSRSFNLENARAQVLCDKDLGLGLSRVNTRQRVRYPTIAKRAISQKIISDAISEELRILYVAMTRAKDRLIMTYAASNLQDDLMDIALRLDYSDRVLLTGSVNCPGEWILQAAIQRSEAHAFHSISDKPDCTAVQNDPWLIRVVDGYCDDATCEFESVTDTPDNNSDLAYRIKDSLMYQYPYIRATQVPSKQTATQLKGRVKDNEAAENAQQNVIHRKFRKPAFIHTQAGATEYGSAMHLVMEHLNFSACTDVDSIEAEVTRLLNSGYLTQEQRDMVNVGHIANFFNQELGQKIRDSQNVIREFKFSVLDDGNKYFPELEQEKILLQGVVDCTLVEDDGIIVIDFKTDRVSNDSIDDTAQKYIMQITAYANALERIYQKNVKAKYLYFFHCDKLIQV